MEISKEQKEAIEYLKIRLYGNKGCKYIDVAQEDLRIFIKLVDRLQKENEELEEINNELEAEKSEAIRRYNFETISIQKVKDKIEELNNNRQYLSQFKDYKEKDYTNEEVVNNCVEVLQELLESE